ncbi:Cochaperone protein [Exophiala xenobiotica]|uniref:Cochaperone protein n=1 Tax=Lithohypha guttulata TaxID=1690604 RepID=A0ABR0K7J5_9EURO|nr:Cochaperone protein [Lithohypha guttulata]KAK5316608.1 Cochaperone protein [Exophiala xenobiotica]
MEHANRGAKALTEGDPATAVVEYTKALIDYPTSPDYFTQRSIAFSRLKPARHDLSLQDAEYGVLCGQKRGKRDKIQAAQHRRVVALYNLEKYADAKLVIDSMKRWRPSNSKPQTMEHDMWSAKIDSKLKNNAQQPTAAEYPSIPLPDDKALKKTLQKQLKKDGSFNFDGEEQDDAPASSTTASTTAQNVATASNTPAMTTAAPQKIRHEWYQNNQNVIITIYAKGVQKDKTEVDIAEDSVSISFPHPSDLSSSFSFSLDPLSALIDPSRSKHQVMSTKVEITLAKVEQGKKWANLEGTAPLHNSNGAAPDEGPARAVVMSTLQTSSTTATAAPSYPTSSRKGPKNWDKLASDLTAKKPKKAKKKSDSDKQDKAGSDSNDEGEDDGYESDMGGDAVDSFFKKLYKDADPDTQRAMMKSFSESNGTALSTNWSEVGKKRVEEVKSKDDK